MTRRTLAMSLALISALSMGFSLPAHAENQAKARKPAQASAEESKIEKVKNDLVERMKNIKVEGMKLYGKSGNEVSFEDFFANPASFSEGVTIGFGDHRFLFRGEMISDGEKGIKIFVSHTVAGSDAPPSGQVITISPEMTKRAIQQRFEDAIASIMLYEKSASVTKAEGKRQVASTGLVSVTCPLVFGFGAVILLIFVAREKFKLPAVMVGAGGLALLGLSATVCFNK